MQTTIDSGGRVVIPKEIRSRLGLSPGQAVEITERDGRVEISSVVTPMRLKDDEPVAVTDREMPVLTTVLVRETLEQVRR